MQLNRWAYDDCELASGVGKATHELEGSAADEFLMNLRHFPRQHHWSITQINGGFVYRHADSMRRLEE